jgi:transcriptional regulator with XRE-family HTH domain
MGAISEVLKADFRDDGEFAEEYAESFLDTSVATQIKVLREDSKMSQKQLGEAIGTTQTAISRIENVNYSARSISTLKKLARAFKVRLHVSFETYGSLIGDVERFNRQRLGRAPRDKDPVLHPELLPSPTEQLKANADYIMLKMDKSTERINVSADTTKVQPQTEGATDVQVNTETAKTDRVLVGAAN